MSLADAGYFTREHIEQHRLGTSAVLAEQAVHSLELVAQLAAAGLSYQFKGGSSLLLILDTPRRFSIDVDIATDETRERTQEIVLSLPERFGTFSRIEHRPHKTKPWLPMTSFYLYYPSTVDPSGESSIMLDVQLRRSPYKTRMVPVHCGELYRCDQKVELPLAASIAGDKLLTMGPATLGIPLDKGKHAQRLKHVFDVSSLMATGPDLADIRESCFACIEHENEIQETTFTAADVMADTLAFCATTTTHADRPDTDDTTEGMLRENAQGLPDFASHLFQAGYDWQALQRDMARVAYCIAATCTPAVTPEQFTTVLAGNAASAAPFTEPDGLSGRNEALYYWRHVAGAAGRDVFGGQGS